VSPAPADLLRLIVILDAAAARGQDLAVLARQAALGGATMLQVRGKALNASALLDATRRVLDAAPAVCVTVNDRLDVALAAGAAGCHLGQDDFPIAEARRMAPTGFVLGGSAGSEAELHRAIAQGADYVGIGPIHATPHKDDAGTAIGVAGFARLHAAAPALPAVAIGGVTAADVPALVAAGAVGVAVIGAVVGAADPEAAARELRDAVERARGLRLNAEGREL
jgi:thiamine-phosphate pyrophosphorylase